MLRHLVLADDLADPFTDPVGSLETVLLAPCGCGNGFKKNLSGLEQFLALAGAVLGQQRIAADHQALPGAGVTGDLHEVPLVKERHLHLTILHQ